MNAPAPPAYLARLMERLLDSRVRYAAIGDFEERFRSIARSRGRRRACAFFWIQVILLVPPFLNNLIYWSGEMLKNYLKTALSIALIIGAVVKDFQFLSLHHTVGPIMLRLLPREDGGGIASVKFATNNIAGSIASIQKAFKNLFPEGTFSYRFLDEDFQQMYLEEKKGIKLRIENSLQGCYIKRGQVTWPATPGPVVE